MCIRKNIQHQCQRSFKMRHLGIFVILENKFSVPFSRVTWSIVRSKDRFTIYLLYFAVVCPISKQKKNSNDQIMV